MGMGQSVPRTLAIIVFYVALALFSMRALWSVSGTAALIPADLPKNWRAIATSDLKLTIALVAANARALTRHPSTLFDGPQCFPLRNATTLGEHGFGLGLLGVVPYVLTGGDPILTFNIVAFLVLVLAGLSMHLLVERWTGSTAAAFVAGTAFAMHPTRVTNLLHLYIVSTQWTPLALLATERLFARRTWAAAAWATLFIGLQTLESAYPLIAFALLGGTYGVWSLVRHRHALRSLAPKLVVVIVCAGAIALAVFTPYLETRRIWGTLGGRNTLFFTPSVFGRGGEVFAGTVPIAFALVALLDRLRGARREWAGDPRLPLALAGLLVAWASVYSVTVPGVGTIPSFFGLAKRIVPALDALRGGGVIAAGVMWVTAILAGFGVAALVHGRAAIVRAGLAALAVGAVLTEVFVPKIARAAFGAPVTLEAIPLLPNSAVVALYGSEDDGPVLDLPNAYVKGHFSAMADWVLLGAFHHRRLASCYNSFHVPLQNEIAAHSANALTDPKEAEALAALGIREVVLHQFVTGQRFVPAPTTVPPHLREVGRAIGTIRYALPAPGPQTADWAPLAAGAAVRAVLSPEAVKVKVGSPTVEVSVTNGGAIMYRRPDPIEPVPLMMRWRSTTGEVLREELATSYLPAVIPSGASMAQEVTCPPPPEPGRYVLTLAPVAQPDLVIANQAVDVTP
jgi:hypothetical protein